MDEFPLNEMTTGVSPRVYLFVFCVLCESRELGGRGGSRFPYDGAPLLKQPTLGVSGKKLHC